MTDSPIWHGLTRAQSLEQLASDPDGLDDNEVVARRAQHGLNRLPAPVQPGPVLRFLRQFRNILIYVLLGSAAITALLGHLLDTGVILAVVLVNALIGFIQEGRAEKAMAAIRDMLAPRAAVLRDGRRTTLDAEQLVPGDIVLLEAGDRVPADLRLLNCHALQIQEAILTGESVPVEKQTDPVEREAALGDRTCLAFSGTTVSSGQGRGVVVAIGAATEIGRISGLLATVETLTTPLLEQMTIFARWLTLFILAVAGLILAWGYWLQQMAFTDLFMAVVGLSVAAIPEGLPAVVTISLAVGVQAMARRQAIVRRLPAIENLGAVSVICTDKTGTLTRNEMSVVTVVTADATYRVAGTGYAPAGEVRRDGEVVAPGSDLALAGLALVAGLCNDAELNRQVGAWSVEGDPMEGALLAFAGRAGDDGIARRRQWTRTDVIPFDAAHKFMATLNHDHAGHAAIFVKGAPEAVLDLCRAQSVDGDTEAVLDPRSWRDRAEQIAARGQRVLALAVREVDPAHTVLEFGDIAGELRLLGLVGLIDPPRPEAVAAIAECRRAGIRVKMITGDHATTAAAIASDIGLEQPGRVLTGVDLDRLDDAGLDAVVVDTDVFARTSPEHKLRLVSALQARGLTVAMTGDGVNDAPALKRADAGIAMGKRGSAAAKEAAELVLADDNFASIVAALREGRTVYDNIKKVISWTLPTSTGEAATIVLALLLGMTLPVTPVQILWVNMITAATLGIALAFEPTEANTMNRPPRPRNQPLLTGVLVWHIALVTGLFLAGVFAIYSYAIERGYPLELARTMAMNTLVVMEIFHLFFIRNMYGTSLTWRAARGTRAVWIAVLLTTAGQFAITYLPPMQAVFATVAVPVLDGLLIVAIGVALFVIIEAEKQLRLRLAGMMRSGGRTPAGNGR